MRVRGRRVTKPVEMETVPVLVRKRSTSLRSAKILVVVVPAVVTLGFMVIDRRIFSETLNAVVWMSIVVSPFILCALTFRNLLWMTLVGIPVLIALTWMHAFMAVSRSSTDSLVILLYLPGSFLLVALGLLGDYYLGRKA
jgi:hypothetical protein